MEKAKMQHMELALIIKKGIAYAIPFILAKIMLPKFCNFF